MRYKRQQSVSTQRRKEESKPD